MTQRYSILAVSAALTFLAAIIVGRSAIKALGFGLF